MNLTRKDFLLRAGAAALPVSLAGAALSAPAADSTTSTPGAAPLSVRRFGAQGDEPAVWLANVRRCFLHGVRAQPSTQTLFKLSGAQTGQIRALANDFTEARTAFQLGAEVGGMALRQESNLLRHT